MRSPVVPKNRLLSVEDLFALWEVGERRRAERGCTMVNDIEARDAVRQLLRRFDLINAQRLSLAYVLAEQDGKEYATLVDEG